MSNRKAIVLLSQMYLPCFDDEEKQAITMGIEALEKQIPKKPIIKSEKEIPITHNYGRLLRFHCPRCERFLVGLYETDVERGGGISRRMKGCSTCLQAIDFTGYYYIGKLGDKIDWSE